MIDLHCHILPGLDDGAKSMDESIAMARIAAEDGVHTIVATPHIREHVYPVDFLLAMVAELNRQLTGHDIAVTIIPGGDVFAMLPLEQIDKYRIGGTPYVLVEFPYSHIPASAGEILFQLVLRGLRPIITHPERNPSVLRDPQVLLDLLGEDILVQITADSLVGRFGREEQSCALHLLRQKAVHIIASDAHSVVGRVPKLSQGVQVAAKVVGREAALRLVRDNPGAVLAGERIGREL